MDTMTTSAVSAVEIEAFRRALADFLARHHVEAKNVGDPPGVEIMMGKKFARIVRTGICERSAYGFI
jgi:hypothetical protein